MIFRQMTQKILFLVPYPLKVSQSQRFRFDKYFDFLTAHGRTGSCKVPEF